MSYWHDWSAVYGGPYDGGYQWKCFRCGAVRFADDEGLSRLSEPCPKAPAGRKPK